jgi:hypothetical protein
MIKPKNYKTRLSGQAEIMKNYLLEQYQELVFDDDGMPRLISCENERELETTYEELLCDWVDSEPIKICGVNGMAKSVGSLTPEGADFAIDRHEKRTLTGFCTPPITNRGVTKYRSEETAFGYQFDKQSPPENDKSLIDYCKENQMSKSDFLSATIGGYDGGVEVGFFGQWKNGCLSEILAQLQKAQERAQLKSVRKKDDDDDDAYIMLGGAMFQVAPHGSHSGKDDKGGIYYKYVFIGHGIKFYIHHNPDCKHIQPMRLRYNYDVLIGRDLFTIHAKTREWLASIGFDVTEEKISRIDMQVTLQRPIDDFIKLIENNHAVCRARKYSINGTRPRIETFSIGRAVQLCLYDKKKELLDGKDERKQQIILNALTQVNFSSEVAALNLTLIPDLTRVEFRLRRDSLKAMNLNTIEDLRNRELDLVAFLTEDWFRILVKPKIRGHENTQEVHPLWKKVQELFRHYFPQNDGERQKLHYIKNNEIRCTGESLLKQSDGCTASAMAMNLGSNFTDEEGEAFLWECLEKSKQAIFENARERAQKMEVTLDVKFIKYRHRQTSGLNKISSSYSVTAAEAREAMDDEAYNVVLKNFGLSD